MKIGPRTRLGLKLFGLWAFILGMMFASGDGPTVALAIFSAGALIALIVIYTFIMFR